MSSISIIQTTGVVSIEVRKAKYTNRMVNGIAGKKYIIGLIRTLLTKSEIIVLYEFPIILSEIEETDIKNILLSLKEEKTIIIFSASEKLIPISNKVYKIERGKIVDTIVK